MLQNPLLTCGRVGTRTLDPLIKSQLLYQLSYETFFRTAKVGKNHT
ncbi:MAG: hypothetical protein K0Q79_3624 [Flavipsychrobacter sp.]|nr:hypothetical protein [Flavipsychrobacter sp.]